MSTAGAREQEVDAAAHRRAHAGADTATGTAIEPAAAVAAGAQPAGRRSAPLTRAGLTGLQRLAGNRATSALVLRVPNPGSTDTDERPATQPEDAGVVAGAPPTTTGAPPVAAPPVAPTPPPGSPGVVSPPPAGSAGPPPGGPGTGSAPAGPTAIAPTRTPTSTGGDGLPGTDPANVFGLNDGNDSSGGIGPFTNTGGGDGPAPNTTNNDSSGGPPGTPIVPPTPPPPQPGIWTTLIADLGGGANAARDVLELLRPIPGYGLLPGMAADTIGLITDQQSFQGLDEPWTQILTALRDITALINNMIGSASSAVETVQDVATASVVGAEVDVVTAPVAMSIKQIKLYIDGFQLGLDVFGAAAAAYNASHAPRGSAELTKNNAILQMFEANILGDVVGGVIDAVDLCTAGFANGDNVKGVGRFLYSFLKAAGPFGRALVGAMNGWFGVHGGGLLPTSSGTVPEPAPDWHPAPGGGGAGGGGDAPPVQRIEANLPDGAGAAAKVVFAQAVVASMDEAHSAWQTADTGLTMGIDTAHQMEAGMRALATQANDGRDPFLQIRDGAHTALDNMHRHVTELTDLHQYAGNAGDKAKWITTESDKASTSLEQIHLPEIHVPHDHDDGIVAGVLNAGADLADSALQAVLGPARSLLDQARDTAREPIAAAKAHAQEGTEFAQFLQDFAQQAIDSLTNRIASFSAGLAKVQNGDQFIDLMLHQVTEALGIPGGAGLDDARNAWNGIGEQITRGQGWAADLLAGAQRDQSRASAAPAGGQAPVQTIVDQSFDVPDVPDGADDSTP